MTPQEIKHRLDELGLTQADLVRKLKKSKTTVSFLVNRKLTSERLEKRLAKMMGVTLEKFRSDAPEQQKAS